MPGVITKEYEEETPEGNVFFGYSEEAIDEAYRKIGLERIK